jgi:hypothetical protein
VAVECGIERLVDDTHAALAKLGDDLIVGYGLSNHALAPGQKTQRDLNSVLMVSQGVVGGDENFAPGRPSFERVSRIIKKGCTGEMNWRPQRELIRTASDVIEALMVA